MFLAQRRLNRSIDHERIKKAIGEAERHTSGEIRVSIAPFFWGSVEKAAGWPSAGSACRPPATATRSSSSWFPAGAASPSSATRGSTPRSARSSGRRWWRRWTAPFRKGGLHRGLVRESGRWAESWRAHFPFEAGRDVNELPDDVDLGRTGIGRGGPESGDPPFRTAP